MEKNPILILAVLPVLVCGCSNLRNQSQIPGNEKIAAAKRYDVAAYIWPSCHHDERFGNMLWPEKTGEWEVIKKGNPRFEGHYQPKIPLWGYELDDDPKVMERWIDAATDHGVNVFIFDWYWYDQGPFLESCLNNGFLKAKNNEKMKFYVMWANHDVPRKYWNVHKYPDDRTLLWDGAVDLDNFKKIVARVIQQYFKRPNYYKINGKPVFSLFSIDKFIQGLGGLEQAAQAMNYFRSETEKAGFPGLHLQQIVFDSPNEKLLKEIKTLGADSVTTYNWNGPHPEDYIRWGVQAAACTEKWNQALSVPYFANVSIGWDDSPRFPRKTKEQIVHLNQSPEAFASFLRKAKDYCDRHPDQPKLITVYAWNEWVEGAYLLPDVKYGFRYLDAVEQVMRCKHDK